VTDPKEDAKVKAQALSVLKRIKAGEDFAKLAGEFGSDSTKEKGGDLGWFNEGQMVPEFETAVFALKDGELNKDLVKTQYGYHIIKKTGERMSRDFNAFMTDQLKATSIKFLVPIHNPFEALQK
jgi:peptidyl-prolyl cis-trans isomerase D